MTTFNKIVECVPNFSEGRNTAIIEKIADCFRGIHEIKLLDYSSDQDHNRMVVTAAGEPEAMKTAIIQAIGTAVQEIDLNVHQGEHPRMGAADVIPFIPIRNMSMQEAIALSKSVAEEVSARFCLPVYLYEESAGTPLRKNLADVRRGQFEGLALKMADPLWKPDFGPSEPHPTAGASIIGARNYLIAYNVNLNTDNIQIAKDIAKKIRFSSGGLPCCKAMGVSIDNGSRVQVSMNLTDFSVTSMYKVFDIIKSEALRSGVTIDCSELIGMLPLQAIVDNSAHYLKLKDFSVERILEYKLSE
jgi:glutamate formiminotransferase / 5-formyltetrahydrofolate cyclo-ligase